MPRPCSVCEHPRRKEIDAALVGETHRAVAKRFGLGESAVYRHKTDHLLAKLAKTSKPIEARSESPEVLEIANADRLVDRVEDLRTRALRLLETVEKGQTPEGGGGRLIDFRAAAALLREARGCLELQARLLGELQNGAAAVVQSPAFLALLRVIFDALAPFPGATEAVVEALKKTKPGGPGAAA